MDWDVAQITEFVIRKTSEKSERAIEGPAILGDFTVWRFWTSDDSGEFHAHYVVAEAGNPELALKRDFQPFANWLQRAFNAKDVHGRRLDWLRSIVAATITLTLLGLVVWAVATNRATTVDFKWLVGALATTALGYLLGGSVQQLTTLRSSKN